jgi:hypothetical protein
VNTFSPYKVGGTCSGMHYTILIKSCMIHTLTNVISKLEIPE